MSAIVVGIGYIILIPSVIGVLISLLALLNIASVPGHDSAAGTIAAGVLMGFGVVSLVSGLLGWLLVMKKDILKCNYCGAVVAAS
jgi:hypothetical protein